MTTGERILELLPATSRTLLAQLDISSTSTFHKWMCRLRAAEEIHIGRWERTRGNFAAVYVRGPGKDARRPRRLTQSELQARYRASLKRAGLYEDYLADIRRYGARYRRAKGQKGYKAQAFDPLHTMFYRKTQP